MNEKNGRKTDLILGTLELLILKTLSSGPSHGYGITHYIQQITEDVLQVEKGSLYPALKRMQLKGWVSSEWKLTPTNRQARYYKLTAAGLKQLTVEIAQYDRITSAIGRLLQIA